MMGTNFSSFDGSGHQESSSIGLITGGGDGSGSGDDRSRPNQKEESEADGDEWARTMELLKEGNSVG